MTLEEAKKKGKTISKDAKTEKLISLLVDSIYADFNREISCENIEHDFTVSTKELCEILNYFKKNMLQ